MNEQTTWLKPNRRRRALPIGIATAALALGAIGCSSSDQTDQSEEPTATTFPEPAPGAADSVDSESEGGIDLDNLNVPGTDADDELDDE